MVKKVPHTMEKHGHVRVDPYYWLNDRDNQEVIAYLEEENRHAEADSAHTKALQEKLFEEMRGRLKPNDASVPYRILDYYYYTRFVEGGEYPLFCRRRGSLEAPEEIILNGNAMAEGHPFFAVGRVAVSPGQNLLAFSVDTVGRREFTIRVRDLDTGDLLADEIPGVAESLVWAADNQTLFYSKKDPQTLRPDRIYRHTLGTAAEDDVLVYHEEDDTYSVWVFKSKSRDVLFIGAHHTLRTEYRFLDAKNPTGDFQIFQPRTNDVEYDVDHLAGTFYIRTNLDAPNFRLMTTDANHTGLEHWKDLVPHRDDVFLEAFELFDHHLVVEERSDGLVRLNIRDLASGEEHDVDFGEPTYTAYIGNNAESDSPVLRFNYTSMTTPHSVYDYDMEKREKTLMKRDEVLGDFKRENYRTERLHATAQDGVQVPISIVYRTDTPLDGSAPLLLYGYGSYGHQEDPTFVAARLSLLDRGFIFAIGHIRGGQELGRQWYEDGKLMKKRNTFTDFIACAEYLVSAGYTRNEHMFALGGSAGGLLMGAVINMRPNLFKGVVAEVPFVDVMTTMLDPNIPLTTGEYDEWGDPNDEAFYHYMLSYSPYDNVEAKDYPHLLVTTGLHDSQVQYWEPAKWVAKLRDLKTDNNRLMLYTDMEAGHGGASGRFKRYHKTAFNYAFLLDLAGRADS